jgi:hypothetical protein
VKVVRTDSMETSACYVLNRVYPGGNGHDSQRTRTRHSDSTTDDYTGDENKEGARETIS